MIRSWTPNEAWLFAELAKRALVVTLDDDVVAQRDGADARFRVEIHAGTDAIRLKVEIDAEKASLRLEPVRVDNNGWREAWALELLRGGSESWVLVPGSAPAVIADARKSPITAELRVKRFAIVRGGGAELDPVPLADIAFHRHTQQSSSSDRAGPLFAPKTKAEASPWWEIDLGKPHYVSRFRFALLHTAGIAAGSRLTVTAHTFATKAGTSPPNSFSRTFDVDALPRYGGDIFVEITEAIVAARVVRVTLTSAAGTESTLEIIAAEILAAEPFAGTLRSTMRRAFAVHGDRTLFLRRLSGDEGGGDNREVRYEPEMTYGEVWRRAMAWARGITRRLSSDGGRPPLTIAVVLKNRPEWVMCDLAAIDRRWTIVPLSPDDPEDRLANILGRIRADVIVCESRNEERLAKLASPSLLSVVTADEAERPISPNAVSFHDLINEGRIVGTPADPPTLPDSPEEDRARLYTILFTSGSTGMPKGAMRSPATFYAMLESYGLSQWPRHLSFQPLSHLSERMIMPWLLIAGAEIAFSRGGEHLTEDLREYGPTELGAVPRLFDVLHAQYKRRLRALVKADPHAPLAVHERTALAEARNAFGPRLRAVSIGSAPVSPEVLAFLKRCFDDLWVTEGYGSTEVGTIALDNKIVAGVDVKLVPQEESAPSPSPSTSTSTEGALERGEIWVKSAHVITGYLGDDGETKSVVDAEGYFPTGDLGERGPDGTVRVIGRLRNAVKLAQGEFVSAERIETVLATARGVDRIYIHAEGGAPGVSALVFVTPESTAMSDGELLTALRMHGQRAGLPAWELPRGVLVERAPPTTENGLLTTSGKLARGTIASRFGVLLSDLAIGAPPPSSFATPPSDEKETGGADDSDLDLDLSARIVRIAHRAVGRPIDPDAPLDAVGVDSLAAAEILAAIGEDLGREVPLAMWFEVSSLAELATRVLSFSTKGTAAKARLIAEDREPRAISPATSTTTRTPPKAILLTGATGLLGAHLVEALLEHAPRDVKVICLVRGDDDAAAEARLMEILRRYEIRVSDDDQKDRRLRVVASDLGKPKLGLEEERFSALKNEVDLVLHSAAEVSWLASYERLRGPNVHGTLELLSLGKPFHFVSTISTAPADGDEWTMLSFEAAASGSPYGLTKWIAEEHVRRAGEAAVGLPTVVYRPAMIAAHSTRGIGNPDDYVHRYLAGVLDLGLSIDRDDARLDMTPVDFVAEGIVKLLLAKPRGEGETYHLVNVDQSMTYAAIGRALQKAGGDAVVKPATYDEFRAALLKNKTSRLHALASYFPESGFAMAMGPWPCERSKKALTDVGVKAPVIDEANIARVSRWLAARVTSGAGA